MRWTHRPDRNDQFLYVGDLRDLFQRRGQPINLPGSER
jgi:hypothetical protein